MNKERTHELTERLSDALLPIMREIGTEATALMLARMAIRLHWIANGSPEPDEARPDNAPLLH